MFDEDAFQAPAFLIPHVAFQSYMNFPFPVEGTAGWERYPAVPVLIPGTSLQLRLVRLIEDESHPRHDALSFAL